MYILIILSSILVLPVAESYWLPKNAVFVILGISLIASSWLSQKRQRTTFRSLWLSIFLIWFAIHFGWYFLKPLVFNDARGNIVYNMWTVLPSINVFLGIMMIYVLVEYTDTYQRWIDTAKVICWLAFGLSIYAILQRLELDQLFKYTHKFQRQSVCMFFGNPMLAGHFLAMVSPLALMFKNPRYIAIYAVMGIAIFATGSASSLAIYFFGLILFFMFMKKWWVSVLLIVMVLLAGILINRFYPGHFDISRRILLWKGTVEFCREKAIMGQGLGYFITRKFYPISPQGSWAHMPHNLALLIWHDMGIIGLGIAGCYLINLFKRLLKVEKSMLLIGFMIGLINYLLVCQVGFPLGIAPLALIGIIYIAGLEVHCSMARGG